MRLGRLVVVCIVPVAVGLAAAALRRAQGPFWLATNQDPAYSYLYDALRVSRGLPPNHFQHPGTTVQLLGAVVVRALHRGGGQGLDRQVLAEPETSLAWLHAALLATALCALAGLGWRVDVTTRKVPLCWVAQAVPFLVPGTLLEMAGAKPEPLLLALSLTMAALLMPGPGPEPALRRHHALLLGLVAGLAMAAKFTAFPLLLVPVVALPGAGLRLRFAGAAILSFLIGTIPILPRLPEALAFLWASAWGPGAYGTGLMVSSYAAALRSALVEGAPIACVAVINLAVALRRPPAERGVRRLLLGLAAAQAVALAVLIRQPYGGARYLVPQAGLLGLNVVLLARTLRGDAAGRFRQAPAALGLIGLVLLGGSEARTYFRQKAEFRRLAREQEGAAGVAQNVGGACTVVAYHKASSVPSALLFGYGRPEVEGGHLHILQSLYPSALFLDYVQRPGVMEPSSFRFLPYQSWTHPRFRDFRGGLPTDDVVRRRPCVAFHGSRGGPGRLFASPEFARESIPLRGRIEPLYSSTTEAVYRVDLDEGPEATGR